MKRCMTCRRGRAPVPARIDRRGRAAPQALSIQPDLLSPAAMVELQKLCDKVPSFDSRVAMELIQSELGRPWQEVRCPGLASRRRSRGRRAHGEACGAVSATPVGLDSGLVLRRSGGAQVYAELSPEPVAAASLGQVYKGRLKTGEVVAVKASAAYLLARSLPPVGCGLPCLWGARCSAGSVARQLLLRCAGPAALRPRNSHDRPVPCQVRAGGAGSCRRRRPPVCAVGCHKDLLACMDLLALAHSASPSTGSSASS
jgi:hypothetical protein